MKKYMKMSTMTSVRLFFAFLITCVFVVTSAQAADLAAALRGLPVQDAGRIKPYDTFAREALHLIYGKEVYRAEGGNDEERPAVEIVTTWVLQPSAWTDVPLVEIRYGELKKALKLPDEKRYFTVNQLMNNERFGVLMQDLASKRETKEKLNPYFQALQRLESQLVTFREIATGRMLRLVPPKEGTAWLALTDMPELLQEKFMKVTKSFVGVLGAVTANSTSEEKENVANLLKQSVQDFKDAAKAENPALYPSESTIRTELHLNQYHPFRLAWISYLLSAVMILLVWVLHKQYFYKAAWLFAFIGLGLHIYGFALRVYLLGRPPVSNMYETVVWVGFGAMIFSMIIEAIYKWRFILFSGALAGTFCLALADAAPAILDSSLQPLEPVLRNNFWLLIHVLTITISYAAFFLAFVLGDIGLIFYLRGEEEHKAKLKAITLAVYRAMQIGISFLAPGIILGGVWADYSWGRFWGWDPKETWALIVLLGYLAVLHGRLVGLVKDFGMISSAVVTFSLVIMAWYGVNYILGAGLHSYGFGAGGVEYVSVFVGLHLLLVVFTAIVRFGKMKEKNSKNS